MKCSGKLSGIHLILLLVLPLFVSGCIVWETEEVKINLTSSNSGNVELTFGPIGSDEKEKPERERDYSLLLYDIINNSNLGNNYIKNLKGKLDKLEAGIYGKITGEFDSLFALENNFDIQISNGNLIRKIASDEELISTNGKVVNDHGSVQISWAKEARAIEYKLRRKGSYMQPAYNKEDSFLPEYKVGVKDEKYYRDIYINHKIKSGNDALEKNEFKSAYGNFGDVLRVDPKNKPVKKEFRRLHFVPYLDAAGMIPLPFINASPGIEADKADKLLELLYNKVSHSPEVIDRFLIGKLELHLNNIKKAYEQFRLAVVQDPGHYPSVVGFFKTKLLLFPEDAGSMLKEIDKFLAKEHSERETDELQFTKGVALAFAGARSKAQEVLTSLLENEGNRPVDGLIDALEVIRQ